MSWIEICSNEMHVSPVRSFPHTREGGAWERACSRGPPLHPPPSRGNGNGTFESESAGSAHGCSSTLLRSGRDSLPVERSVLSLQKAKKAAIAALFSSSDAVHGHLGFSLRLVHPWSESVWPCMACSCPSASLFVWSAELSRLIFPIFRPSARRRIRSRSNFERLSFSIPALFRTSNRHAL